jgi:hypothetical protein
MWGFQVSSDPVSDIHWVTDPSIKPIDAFVQGKIDRFLGFSPEPQALRARNVRHVVVNSALDRPWSEYFCMLAGNSDYVTYLGMLAEGFPNMLMVLGPHTARGNIFAVGIEAHQSLADPASPRLEGRRSAFIRRRSRRGLNRPTACPPKGRGYWVNASVETTGSTGPKRLYHRRN